MAASSEECEDYEGTPPQQPPALTAPRGLAGIFDGEKRTSPYEPLDTSSLPGNFVLVNVYDIGDAEVFRKINKVSTVSDKVLIGGIFHAGVEIFGLEWSFGFTEEDVTGVSYCVPRTHPQHTYRVTVKMGETEFRKTQVNALILKLMDTWRGCEYDLIHHNCLDYANDLCKELGVGRIPGWIDRFGRAASSLDNFYANTSDRMQRTSTLVRSVTADLDSKVRSGEAAQAGREAAQNLQVNLSRWGSGLLGAAQRALGDDRASQAPRGGGSLREALRNRGGIQRAPESAATAREARGPRRTPGADGLDAPDDERADR